MDDDNGYTEIQITNEKGQVISVLCVPDYVAEGKRKQWLEVFNSAFASARAKGLSAKECEASAFRQANGVVKSAILEIVKDAIDIFLKRDISTASRNDLPDSAFAYIEPGGTKDESGKTTPRSKRHFPIHDAGTDDSCSHVSFETVEYSGRL